MNTLTEAQETSLEECQDSNPVIQKALHLPDILTLLFSFCSKATLASLARVCSSWSIKALWHLWRELKDPLPLVRLLGSVEKDRSCSAYIYVSPSSYHGR